MIKVFINIKFPWEDYIEHILQASLTAVRNITEEKHYNVSTNMSALGSCSPQLSSVYRLQCSLVSFQVGYIRWFTRTVMPPHS